MPSDEALDNLRTQVDNLEAQLSAAKTELGFLKTENRGLRAERLFEYAKLSAKQVPLFVRELGEDEDIDADAVTAFAEKYDLKPSAETSSTEDAGKDKGSEDLSDMSGAGVRPGAGGAGSASGSMSRDEYKDLHKKSPAAAADALARGRVRLRDDNFYVQRGAVSN